MSRVDMCLERLLHFNALFCLDLERVKVFPYVHLHGRSRFRSFGPRNISSPEDTELN